MCDLPTVDRPCFTDEEYNAAIVLCVPAFISNLPCERLREERKAHNPA